MNNFAELSGGDNTTFFVRWRGRQEGPYPTSIIAAKLAKNEIGLLHEIFHNGQWVAIRDFIAEREAILRAEIEAHQQQEQHAREESERLAKAQENARQDGLLAEERRKNALLESARSRENSPPPIHQQTSNGGSSGLRTLGALFLIAGLAVAGYFFLAYDTSVESGYGRVNNLGLMADRQNGIIIGIGLGVAGTIMFAIGSRGKN